MKKSNARVLITGGCGFIGFNLVDYVMHNTGWDVVVLDNLSAGKKRDLEAIDGFDQSRVDFVKGDIRHREDVSSAVAGCDGVVNLAAQTDVMRSVDDPVFDAENNILGVLNVLEACRDHDVGRVVQASSAAPVGEQDPPIHEEMVARPLSAYGASKLAGEGYCSAFSGSYDMCTVALRFSNVYGPYSHRKGSVVALFIRQLLAGEQPRVFGDGEQTRDFVHAADVAQAVCLSLTRDIDDGFHLFQIGTGVETTVNRLYQQIQQELEQHGFTVPEPRYCDARKGEIYRSFADISKAQKELGFTPQVNLSEGLRETVDWFVSQHKEESASVVE